VRGESGQATVEWVALVLLAALVLGAAALFSGRETDRGVGDALAKRMAAAPSALERALTAGGAERSAAAPPEPSASAPPAPSASAPPAPSASAPSAPSASAPPAPSASAPPASPGPNASPPPAAFALPAPRMAAPPAVQAFRALRGLGDIAKRTWIVCLGYRRWRHELEHPTAPTEALPLDAALSIVNDCVNPHDYLVED
jgi:hypothetical protein